MKRNFKKLTALAMTAAMLTSLAGCGSNDNAIGNSAGSSSSVATSISEAFEMASNMEKFTLSGSLKITASGDLSDVDDGILSVFGNGDEITIGTTWEGKADTANNAADISIGMNYGSKNVEILDYVQTDGDAYIGIGTMEDAAKQLVEDILSSDASYESTYDEVMSELDDMLAELPDGDYLKVSEEYLNEIADVIEDAYGDVLDEAGISLSGNSYEDMLSELMGSDEYEEAEEVISYFADIIVAGMKNSSCFTNSGNTYTLTISSDNINDILAGILEQVINNSEEIAAKVNSLAGEEMISSSDLEQMAALFSAYDIPTLLGISDYDFSFSVSASYADGTFKCSLDFTVSDGTNKLAVSLENTAKEDSSIKISAPTDVISDEDAEPILEGVMSLIEEGADEYGDLLSDDEWLYDDDYDYDYDDYDWDYDYDYDDYDWDDYDWD